jgi:glucosamine--fructose-6-phosphate aminotransferase (isomerizing)
MCGIVGYAGLRDVRGLLLNGLRRVEYRGYDSCGIAIRTRNGLEVFKNVGFVEHLEPMVPKIDGVQGIGHTRWATVGNPTSINAHPHVDCCGKIAIVHNGDIANYYHLREQLRDEGHVFSSETDSEVLVHLVEKYHDGDLPAAVAKALKQVDGTYALIVISSDSKVLVTARRESPVVVGLGNGENVIASDVPALLGLSNEVAYLEDGDLAVVSSQEVSVWHNEISVSRQAHRVTWSPEDLDKGRYEHYFLKEINEQPQIVRDILANRGKRENNFASRPPRIPLGPVDSLLFAGCGTAFHAAQFGAEFFSWLGVPRAFAAIASEVTPRNFPGENHWAILVSQSGETADTIELARFARSVGFFTVAVTNNPQSSLARVVDHVEETHAGLEISVAASKTFLAQLSTLILLGLELYPPTSDVLESLIHDLKLIPGKLDQVIALDGKLKRAAERISPSTNTFLISKGSQIPVAMEGALKLKEIAYIHAEAYPAGELKHGPFALLGPDTPVIVLLSAKESYLRLLNTIKEVKARGSPIIVITDSRHEEVDALVDQVILLPETDSRLSPLLTTVALQILAYYCAVQRGCPVDRPRNLAKSVTVH